VEKAFLLQYSKCGAGGKAGNEEDIQGELNIFLTLYSKLFCGQHASESLSESEVLRELGIQNVEY